MATKNASHATPKAPNASADKARAAKIPTTMFERLDAPWSAMTRTRRRLVGLATVAGASAGRPIRACTAPPSGDSGSRCP